MIYFWIFTAIVIIFILFVKIEFLFVVNKTVNASIIIFNKKIPLAKKKLSKKELPKETQKAEKVAQKGIDYLNLTLEIIGNFREFIRKRIRFDKLTVDVSIGLDDAPATAIAVGSFWGIIYTLLGLIDRFITICPPNVNVTPKYNETAFSFYAEGIIKTRTAHIISIGLIVFIKYLKYKRMAKREENKK